jgi:signal transduction histidine kinase
MTPTSHRSMTGSPWAVWLILLAMAALSECLVMLILPWILPSNTSRLWESIVDTLLLSILLSPLLWWLVVRPLRESIQFRERYMAQLLSRIEDERRRIAQELHDGVGQSLTLLVSGLKTLQNPVPQEEVVQRSTDLQKLGQQSLKDIRHIMLGLRPTLLDDLGLEPALNRLAEDAVKQYPLAIQVECQLACGEHLPQEMEIALYRIAQEALSNVIKHAYANHMTIRLRKEPTTILLEVTDDGCGMDARQLQRLQHPDGHLGLIGMRERIAVLGGIFQLRSSPGNGTQIMARIPLGNIHHG